MWAANDRADWSEVPDQVGRSRPMKTPMSEQAQLECHPRRNIQPVQHGANLGFDTAGARKQPARRETTGWGDTLVPHRGVRCSSSVASELVLGPGRAKNPQWATDGQTGADECERSTSASAWWHDPCNSCQNQCRHRDHEPWRMVELERHREVLSRNDLLKRQVRNGARCWTKSLTSHNGMRSRPQAFAGESLIKRSTSEMESWANSSSGYPRNQWREERVLWGRGEIGQSCAVVFGSGQWRGIPPPPFPTNTTLVQIVSLQINSKFSLSFANYIYIYIYRVAQKSGTPSYRTLGTRGSHFLRNPVCYNWWHQLKIFSSFCRKSYSVSVIGCLRQRPVLRPDFHTSLLSMGLDIRRSIAANSYTYRRRSVNHSRWEFGNKFW